MNLVNHDRMTKVISVVLAVIFGVLVVTLVANAVTTISTNIETGGTLSVTGVSTLTGNTILSTASSTDLVKFDSLRVAKAGTTNNTIEGINFGFCTFASVNITASSSDMATCSSATGVESGDRIFVMATSSLPDGFVITAASSTASDVIQLRILNHGQSGAVATGINSINFWAVR
jgi:hypothetical protein